MDNYREKLKKITTFIFDFDGVLSDGKVYVFPDGDQIRSTDTKDGYALHYALKQGYRIAIISGGYSESMKLRFQNYEGLEIYLKVFDKINKYEEYKKKYALQYDEIMYMGDDIPDYPVMQLSGVKCCPADASEEIKAIADYVSFKNGGAGCVRDVIEQTMKAQEKWMKKDAFIW